jgi:cytoskeletal protein RodZ
MGDQIRGIPDSPTLNGEARTVDDSIGLYLARERRMRGISLDELANITKIPRRSLERLEAGAFDRNPDGFVRGFVRTVAVGLGLSPEEAVMRMLGEPPESGEMLRNRPADARRWLLVASGFVAVVAGLAVAAWQWYSSAPPAEVGADGPEIVYRHDAIRALTEAQDRSETSGSGADRAAKSVGSPDGQHPD